MTFRVRVQPRAAREELAGERSGALLVRLTAPPVEGAANAALLKLMAKTLCVAPSAITLLRGRTRRDKLLHVDGVGAATVRARLATEAQE